MVVSIILFGFLSRRGFDSPHLHRVTIVQVHGGLDFGSSYSGVVTSVQNLPEYEMCWLTVSGVVTIYPDWGDPIEKKDDEIIVPYHKDMKRAELL